LLNGQKAMRRPRMRQNKRLMEAGRVLWRDFFDFISSCLDMFSYYFDPIWICVLEVRVKLSQKA